MVWQAWKKVKANQGSAGVDEVSIKKFEGKLGDNLYKLWNRLASGSYFPLAVKEVEIPKENGQTRKLGIPTVSDRVAQMVIKNHLENRIDKNFHSQSYGYRPNKSAHDALRQVRTNTRVYDWVIDMDIKGFFDNIDHELLMKAVDKVTKEKWVKLYIRRWLEMPIAKPDGSVEKKEGKGTPQGGVISPLLANLFLHYAFDEWITRKHPSITFVRYADDIVVHCKTQQQAVQLQAQIAERMKQCQLELHEGKTKTVYCKDYKRKEQHSNVQFDFLGYTFQPRPTKSKDEGKSFLGYDLAISRKSRKKIIEQIRKTKFHQYSVLTLEEIARNFNPKIRGWINYYGVFRKSKMRGIFKNLNSRLIKWVRNTYKSLNRSWKQSALWLAEQQRTQPELFAHWKAGFAV